MTDSKSSKIKEDRHFVTSLSRGLDVLSCFNADKKLLGNMEIATRCKLPKSTVSRLTYTLTKLGYLTYVEEFGKYRLGSATLSLGSSALANLDIRAIARPLMQELADMFQVTVSLATRDRLSMIYIENVRSSSALTLSLQVGSKISIIESAIGRAYLAGASEEERAEIYALVRKSQPETADKLIKAAENSLVDFDKNGCTSSFGEWQKDINAIAVPFRQADGMPLMAMNCAGAAFQFPPEIFLEKIRPELLNIIQKLKSYSKN